jgi:tol-pal system protein YbgF
MKKDRLFPIIFAFGNSLSAYLPFSFLQERFWLEADTAKPVIGLPSPRRQFLTVMLLLLLLAPAGCGANFPGAKKALPPQTQSEPAHEPLPPTPLEPGPATKTATTPVSASRSATVADTRLADLASQFEALRSRLQIVEGKLAEQENQLNQWRQSGPPQQSQLRDHLTSLERDLAATQERLARLESGRSSQTARVEPAPSPYVREVTPPPTAAKTGGDPWQEGINLYKQKSYGPAREKFQQFLKENPRGDKALEGRYYLADSLLQDKKYDEAIVEFSRVVESSPKSSFAPPSLLKQAQAFKAQGKTKVSNLVLEKLIADYPKSPEAVQARKLQGKTP